METHKTFQVLKNPFRARSYGREHLRYPDKGKKNHFGL